MTSGRPSNNSRANQAVWITANKPGFEVKEAPYPRPRANEIVLENKAIAINPVDWIMQSVGDIAFPWIKYPFVLGSDVAGIVTEVGASITRFKIGDRVFGHAAGMDKKRNSSAEGAFQLYTVLVENMAAPIPDSISYENAAVLPLGLSTAACGLYEKDQLALTYPTKAPSTTGDTVLIWGGSTSVGSNAIQLAVASGYEVITTSSPKNFDYVKKLGASQSFDYKSPTVVSDIVKAFAGRNSAGALAIGIGTAKPCIEIISACKGRKFVSMASSPVSFDGVEIPRKLSRLIPTMARFVAANVSMQLKARTGGIRTNFIFGTSLMENEISRVIYSDYMPDALASGSFVPAPDPVVIGHGLESIPAALDAQKRGVSAKKLIVTL